MAANEEGEFIIRIFSEVANTIPKYNLTANRIAAKQFKIQIFTHFLNFYNFSLVNI